MNDKLIETIKTNIEEMAYNNKYINMGMERKLQANEWTKGYHDRLYFTLICYTLNGRYKGQYKCGYIDLVNNVYVAEKGYDDIDGLNKEYIGR